MIFLGSGSVGDGLTAFAASRNAVEGCADALREELKPYGVSVCTLDTHGLPAESLFKAPIPQSKYFNFCNDYVIQKLVFFKQAKT